MVNPIAPLLTKGQDRFQNACLNLIVHTYVWLSLRNVQTQKKGHPQPIVSLPHQLSQLRTPLQWTAIPQLLPATTWRKLNQHEVSLMMDSCPRLPVVALRQVPVTVRAPLPVPCRRPNQRLLWKLNQFQNGMLDRRAKEVSQRMLLSPPCSSYLSQPTLTLQHPRTSTLLESEERSDDLRFLRVTTTY